MALAIRKAAPLKPEIRLAQAISEFEANLGPEHKKTFQGYRGQAPPEALDVLRLTAEIDRDGARSRKTRQCVGPRLMSMLEAVQQFASLGDMVIGGSQNLIASSVWGVFKMLLQLSSEYFLYFDKLTHLLMTIGRSSPRYREMKLMYPKSSRLQNLLIEYYVIAVQLCSKAVVLLKASSSIQFRLTVAHPFGSEFNSFRDKLQSLAEQVREEMTLVLAQEQQMESREQSRFRKSLSKMSDKAAQELADIGKLKRFNAKGKILKSMSEFDYQRNWKLALKKGNPKWFIDHADYRGWLADPETSLLWCSGNLGAGKTVLCSRVVEDLALQMSESPVACFFCSYDECESLKARTIIGTLTRNILELLDFDMEIGTTYFKQGEIDGDAVRKTLLHHAKGHQIFIIIDGLDECEKTEAAVLTAWIQEMMQSALKLKFFISGRPAELHREFELLKPRWKLSLSEATSRNYHEISSYIGTELERRLQYGELKLGDPSIVLKIHDALTEKAQGMFLWVALMMDEVCSKLTDDAILAAIENLPKALPEVYDRVVFKINTYDKPERELCRKIFSAVATVRRPLTISELREALNTQPGSRLWRPDQLINDMIRATARCGTLINIDEEESTVRFSHHSIKQYFLSSEQYRSLKDFDFSHKYAEAWLASVSITYLNLDAFDSSLARLDKSTTVTVTPLNLVGNTLPASSITKEIALKFLRYKKATNVNIEGMLREAAIKMAISDRKPSAFLRYAKEFWLIHSGGLEDESALENGVGLLFSKLCRGENPIVQLPWKHFDGIESSTGNVDVVRYALDNKHYLLAMEVLRGAKWDPGRYEPDLRLRHMQSILQPAPKHPRRPFLHFLALTIASSTKLDTPYRHFEREWDSGALNGSEHLLLRIACAGLAPHIVGRILAPGDGCWLQDSTFRTLFEDTFWAINTRSRETDGSPLREYDPTASLTLSGRRDETPDWKDARAIRVIEILLAYGADREPPFLGESLAKSPLMMALDGPIFYLELLLERPPFANRVNSHVDKMGLSLLWYAVNRNLTGAASVLLAHGADIKTPHVSNSRAVPRADQPLLLIAYHNGNLEMAKLLLDAGADPNEKYRGLSIQYIVETQGNKELLKGIKGKPQQFSLAEPWVDVP